MPNPYTKNNRLQQDIRATTKPKTPDDSTYRRLQRWAIAESNRMIEPRDSCKVGQAIYVVLRRGHRN